MNTSLGLNKSKYEYKFSMNTSKYDYKFAFKYK
jgi:hypothetical protein